MPLEIGVVIPSYGRLGDPGSVLRIVDAAEELGFDGAWFPDHVVIPDYATGWLPPPLLDAMACCLVGLGRTRRLRFGIDVLVLPYRRPLVLAQLAASASALGERRLVLGVGVGYLEGEFAALGVPYRERGMLTDEALRTMRRAWSEPLPEGRLAVGPGSGCGVPLWVGGNVGPGRRRAAMLGDGWHPLWPTPEEYAASRAEIVALRAEAGIDRPFTFSLSSPLGRVLDAPRARWEVPAATPPSPAEFSYSPPVPRDADGRPRFVGTADQLRADLDAYASAGVQHVVLRFWTSSSPLDADGVIAQMERFAGEVGFS